MFEKCVGFIGCGNMAKAMIQGMLGSNQFEAKKISIFDRKIETNQFMANTYRISIATDIISQVNQVDIVILAVKPNAILSLLKKLTSITNKNIIFVSIAAGITLRLLEKELGAEKKIIRAMPNIPSLVNVGMSSITPNNQLENRDIENIITLFSSFGKVSIVAESLIHTVVGVSGSSPAYVFLLIEAMTDATVLGGMPRAQAYQFAAQAVKGAAQMVLQSDKHPAELKDAVCSPGGTTIEAIKLLEEKGFRSAIIAAVEACINKSKKMESQ